MPSGTFKRGAAALVASFALCGAALLAPRSADAFCGFYVGGAGADLFNNATMVVMMRRGTRTVLSMQNNYQGPPKNFAMVVPVPIVLQKENVKTLPRGIFQRVDRLAAPRLVEYWEIDPCRKWGQRGRRGFGAGPKRRSKGRVPRRPSLGVKIEAKFAVGEYKILILSAKHSTGLETWLKQRKYSIPKGAAAYLRPYVQGGSKFFVAKVDIKKIKFENGQVTLSPLRVHYDSQEFKLPIRLGMMNSQGTQDLIVHILAERQRYEVANYKNVTIPTNLAVANEVRERFGEFYAALFDETLKRNPGAVVTEYAWNAGSCDPCPSPPLSQRDIMTLGGDVIYGGPKTPQTGATKPGATNPLLGSPRRPRRRRRWRRRRPRRTGFVLTRLHARYKKGSIKDDLVFRKASKIVGGRERKGPGGKLEHGAHKGYINNFQGRYIIRHAWTKPITCQNPIRGRWGGPPGRHRSKPSARPATNLAFAKRGAIKLASLVRRSVPELGIKIAEPKPLPQGPGVGAATMAPPTGMVGTGDKGVGKTTGDPQLPVPQPVTKKKKGCGCTGTGSPGPVPPEAALLLLLALGSLWRRRR